MVTFVDRPPSPGEIWVRRDEEVNQRIRVVCCKENDQEPVRLTIDETWELVDKLVRVVGEIRASEEEGGDGGGH